MSTLCSTPISAFCRQAGNKLSSKKTLPVGSVSAYNTSRPSFCRVTGSWEAAEGWWLRPAAGRGTKGRQADELFLSGARKEATLIKAVLGEREEVATKADRTDSLEEGGAEEFQWTKHWYAATFLDDLDEKKPYAISILGKRLVIWKDGQGDWRCFADQCPHRCASLSEGRIEPKDGSLQCTYHGWRFGASGQPVCIPQLAVTMPSEADQSRALQNPRCAVQSYPTTIELGILWIWPDDSPNAMAESAKSKPYRSSYIDVLREHYKKEPSFKGYARDLPVAHDLLMENISDQSHVPFTHHGVTHAGRDSEWAGCFKVSQVNVDLGKSSGFSYGLLWSPSGKAPPADHFCRGVAPSAIEYHIAEGIAPWAQFYLTPLTPHSTRVFVVVYNNQSLNSFTKPYSTFNFHKAINNVFDGDIPHLTGQAAALYQAGDEQRAGNSYSLPANADLPVTAWRKWFTRFAKGSPFVGAEANSAPPLITMSREQLMDRYTQHTRNCRTCKQIADNLALGQKGAQSLATISGFLSLTGAALTRNVGAEFIAPLVVAMAALAGQKFMESLEKELHYKGYDHSS